MLDSDSPTWASDHFAVVAELVVVSTSASVGASVVHADDYNND